MLGHSFFTFHNVSINTGRSTDSWTSQCSLHSTMFLLIPYYLHIAYANSADFTFHNVSINTCLSCCKTEIQHHFTFHNVSINTEIDAKIDEMVADFTFHNVSINTVAYGMAETAPISVFTFHNVSINTYSDRRS